MDVDLARTLIAIVETGSFKEAANKLHLTQSTISARIKTLEDVLGRRLLERSKAGISLTPAGENFLRHATTLVRVWRHAMLEVAMTQEFSSHLAVGAQLSLWEGFLLRWIADIRERQPGIAITANVGGSDTLVEQLTEGTIDLAVVYRANQRPGLLVEHVFEEELVLVASPDNAAKQPGAGYVFVNWGPEFAADHAETYPDQLNAALHLDLGSIAVNYLFDTRAAAYLPLRVAAPYLADDRLRLAPRARRFVYPVYAVYPEDREDERLESILAALRQTAETVQEAESSFD